MLSGVWDVTAGGLLVAQVFVQPVDEDKGTYIEHWAHLQHLFGRADASEGSAVALTFTKRKTVGGSDMDAKRARDANPGWVYTAASCAIVTK